MFRVSNRVLDELREVGSIGSGNAFSVIADAIGQRIVPKPTETNIGKKVNLQQLIVSHNEELITVFAKIFGDAQGVAIFSFPKRTAYALVDFFTKKDLGATKRLSSRAEIDALAEICNMIIGQYLSALNKFLGMTLAQEAPIPIPLRGENIADFVGLSIGEKITHVVYITTPFAIEQNLPEARLTLLVGFKGADEILKRLEKK